jgi:hypothetical protein
MNKDVDKKSVVWFTLQPPGQEGEEGEGGAQGEEEDTTVYKYVPPESKEWVSLGSQKEIKEESVTEMRRRVCFISAVISCLFSQAILTMQIILHVLLTYHYE